MQEEVHGSVCRWKPSTRLKIRDLTQYRWKAEDAIRADLTCAKTFDKVKLLFPSSLKMLTSIPLLFLNIQIANRRYKPPSLDSCLTKCFVTKSNKTIQQEHRLRELSACQQSHPEQKLRRTQEKLETLPRDVSATATPVAENLLSFSWTWEGIS